MLHLIPHFDTPFTYHFRNDFLMKDVFLRRSNRKDNPDSSDSTRLVHQAHFAMAPLHAAVS